jgi:hypothetical protein
MISFYTCANMAGFKPLSVSLLNRENKDGTWRWGLWAWRKISPCSMHNSAIIFWSNS